MNLIRKSVRKQIKAKSNSTTHSKARVYWETNCPAHGRVEATTGIRRLRVNPPKSRRIRRSGCPLCNQGVEL